MEEVKTKLTEKQKIIAHTMHHKAGLSANQIADFLEKPINEVHQVLGPVLLKE